MNLEKEVELLRKQNRDLRFSQRKQLVDKLLKENLELAEENQRLKETLKSN